MKIHLKNARLAFPSLWQPQAFQGDGPAGTPTYQATLLIPKDHPQVKELSTAIREAAKKKWPDKYEAYLQSMKMESKLCMRNGDTKPDYQGYPGNLFIRCAAKTRPIILDRDARTHLVEGSGRPYGGCNVNASIDIYANAHPKGGKRVNASILGIQFVSDNDAFGAGPPASVGDFESLEDNGSEGFGTSEAVTDDPW